MIYYGSGKWFYHINLRRILLCKIGWHEFFYIGHHHNQANDSMRVSFSCAHCGFGAHHEWPMEGASLSDQYPKKGELLIRIQENKEAP